MTTKELAGLGETMTKLSALAETMRAASGCDLRNPAGDPTGRGQPREVAFAFANAGLALAFLDAVKAATVRPAAAPPIDGAKFTKAGV